MGWSGADDPYAQIELTFSNLSAAIAYAEREGLDYRVIEPPSCRRVAKYEPDTIVGPDVLKRSAQMVPARERMT